MRKGIIVDLKFKLERRVSRRKRLRFGLGFQGLCPSHKSSSDLLDYLYFSHLFHLTDDSDDQLPSPHAPFAQHPGGGAAGGNGKHHHSQSIASSLTGTDDETDDFDWETSGSEDSDEEEGTGKKTAIRAKRGRKIYLGCLRLARPVRLLLTGVIGSAICMVPFIVMTFSFQNDPVRPQVVVSSKVMSGGGEGFLG